MRTSVDVHNYLLERDVPHELVPVRGRFRRADRMAEVLGLPREQVGRVVLLQGAKGPPVVVLAPSDRDPDPGKVAAELGTGDLAEVLGDRVADLTGYMRETLPPVPPPKRARLLIDDALARQQVLYFHGGETRLMLKVRPADLIRATDAITAAVTR